MHRGTVSALLLLTASIAFAQSPAGLWLGTLEAGPTKLRLALHVEAAANGGFNAKVDSLDQGAMGIPVTSVKRNDRSLTFSLNGIKASYTAEIGSDGSQMTGTWEQGGVSMPLTLKRTDQIPEILRPQEPHKPYPYKEEDVKYPNPSAGIQLAGTLTTPAGNAPFPAVLLITGSGPQNRDEELLGHRPFLIISDYLTRHGIAVLRVDDRGIGQSTGSFAKATTADFATDVQAGIAWLKTRPEIDHARIGLIGHSEGGIIAPLVASQSADVAFIVMLAGTAVPGDQVLTEQQMLVSKSMGVPGEVVAQNRALNEKLFAILRAESKPEEAEKKLAAVAREALAQMPEDQRKLVQPGLEAQVKSANSPWFRYFLTYDPGPALRKLPCPVLAMNGELDVQVSARQNLPVIAKALEEAGNRDYEIVKLPKLNHLFQTATTGSPSEYAAISETFSPLALDILAQWILRHTQP